MSTEIDRLELVIEAQASKANKALDSMINRMGNLDKIMSSINFDSFKDSSAVLENLGKQASKVGSQMKKATPKIDTSDIKKGLRDVTSLMDRFKDVGKDFKFEGTYDQLIKEIQKAEKELVGFRERAKEFSDIGGDEASKPYFKMQRNIAKTVNKLDILKNKQKEIDAESVKAINDMFDRKEAELKASMPKFSVASSSPSLSDVGGDLKNIAPAVKVATEAMSAYGNEVERVKSISSTAFEFNKEAMADVFGEAAKDIRNYGDAVEKYGKQAGLVLNGKLAPKIDTSDIKKGLKEIEKEQTDVAKSAKKSSKGAISIIGNIGKKLQSVSGIAKKTNSSVGGIFKTISGIGSRALRGFGLNLKFSLGQMFKFAVVRRLINMSITAIIQGFKEGANNLAQFSSSFNKDMSMIKSSLTQLKNSFATAFAPILSVVAPILTNLINMLSKAVTHIGMFFAALTGASTFTKAIPVTENYAAGLGDIGDKATSTNKQAKELKKTLLGFDQINALNDNSASDNDSGSGNSGSNNGVNVNDMFENVSVDSKIKDFADKFKKAWETADFTEIGRIVGSKLNSALESIPWDNIKATARKIARSIATFLNGFIAETDWRLVGATLGEGFNTAIEFLYTFITTFDWKKFGKAIADSVNGFFERVDWKKAGKTVSEGVKGLLDTLIQFLKNTDWKKIGESIGEFLASIEWGELADKLFEVIGLALAGLSDFIGGLLGDGILGEGFTALSDWIKENQPMIEELIKIVITFAAAWGIVSTAMKIASAVGAALSFLASPAGIAVLAIAGLIAIGVALYKNWDEISEWLKKTWEAIVDKVTEICGKIKDAFDSFIDWISTKWNETWTKVKDVFASFSDWIRKKWDETKAKATEIWNKIIDVFKGVSNFIGGIFEKDWSETFGVLGHGLNSFLANVKNIFDGVKRVFSGIIQFIKGVFTGDWRQAWEGIKNIFGGIFDAVFGIVKQPLNGIIGLLNGLISGIAWAVNGIANMLNSISVDIPDWVPVIGGGRLGFNLPTWTPGRIGYFAQGGFPNMGELFVANEAGPEMVGKMGNRNVVANNNQIVDGIKHGVSDALVDVMMAMQGGQQAGNEVIEIPLIIGDEELARAVHSGRESLIERGVIRPEFA